MVPIEQGQSPHVPLDPATEHARHTHERIKGAHQMSTTLQQRPDAGTPGQPSGKPPRDIWSRRLAVGLPIVVVLLLVIVANQIGGILIAQDLRDEYGNLVAEGRDVLA